METASIIDLIFLSLMSLCVLGMIGCGIALIILGLQGIWEERKYRNANK